ncbi:hypothetical protein, partial [Microcoleus sp. PH2017_01_SCD_O_A]|uniref:hypothetical protein n=1 Tax=Microcoleus sp. PH2017_01_SCD_O_A TaxID=2798812 RepID=UPI0025F6B714
EGGRLPGHRASDVRVRARRLVKPRLRCVRPKHKASFVSRRWRLKQEAPVIAVIRLTVGTSPEPH